MNEESRPKFFVISPKSEDAGCLPIPEVEAKIQAGTLSLTAVAQAQTYFRAQEKEDNPLAVDIKKDVLKSLENKSTRECEKVLIRLSPTVALKKERVKAISPTHVQATITLSNELHEKLARIKSLLSHTNPNMSQAELIEKMAEIVLNKIDPLRKAASVRKVRRRHACESLGHRQREQRNASSARIVVTPEGTVPRAAGPAVPVSLRRETFERDRGRCSFVSPITGESCESQFLLEVDHIVPKALGGLSTPENLRLLCRAHNQRAAIKVFGTSKMEKYLAKKPAEDDELLRRP